jgi:Leucine-rich repeat (LRR) protein
LFKLTTLSLTHNSLTDASLIHLKSLTNLTSLNISFSQVTGFGLIYVGYLRKLRELRLSNSEVKNNLGDLRNLTNLTLLDLSYTKVGKGGMKCLRSLTNLTNLLLEGTILCQSTQSQVKPQTNRHQATRGRLLLSDLPLLPGMTK